MTRVVADDQALAEKKRRRESLQATHDALDDLDPCLSLWDLGALNILRLPMTLEDNDGPIFFKPYPARIENPPNGDSAYSNDGNLAVWLAHYFLHCSLPGDGPPNISYLDQQQLKSRALSNLAPGFQWEVHLLLRIRRNSEPHAVAILSSEMKKESNDDLYRGEIQAIVRIMQRRLKRRCREPNVMAPVLLFSASRQHHLRVIEAFHDGDKLVVRTTPLYDMGRHDQELVERLARWGLGGYSSLSTCLA